MEPNEISPLAPVNFFQLHFECLKLPGESKKGGVYKINDNNFDQYKLPLTDSLTKDRPFANIALGWSHEGLECCVKVDEPFIKASFPNLSSGDSVELFIDTRDIKTSGYNTRFCHHFYFLPESVDGRTAGEITRFRTDDKHDLCEGNELRVKSSIKKNSYVLNIFIPSSCLVGYDPDQYGRLGFTYRINHGGESMHLSVITSEYQLEQLPSLWSSLRLGC